MHSPLATSARTYLLSFDGIEDQILDNHLQNWKTLKRDTKREIFKTFLNHAKNRQSMPNTIGDIEKLSGVLFGFEPEKVADAYPNHVDLLQEILRLNIRTPKQVLI